MIQVKNKSGIRLTSTPCAIKNHFYPKMLETLQHQRDPQQWRGALKRLSSSDMADNPTTREDNTKNIQRKEKTQQLAHKLAGDIYFLTALNPPPENVRQIRLKIEPSRTERNPQVFAKRPRCWKITLKKGTNINDIYKLIQATKDSIEI